MTLPIFFINLAHRADRLAHIEGQLLRTGLSATRIEAVTPADISADERAEFCDPTKRWCQALPTYACSRSHVRCWEALLATGASWALILEDDAVLSSHLRAFLTEFQSLPPKVDIVQIERSRNSARVLPPFQRYPSGTVLHRFRSTVHGTAGYLISRDCARALREVTYLSRYPIDYALFRPYQRPGSLIRSALSNPAYVRQANPTDNKDAHRSDNRDGGRKGWDGATGGRLGRAMTSVRNTIDSLAHLPLGQHKIALNFAD